MTYEEWRCTFQSSEQAARAAWLALQENENDAWKTLARRAINSPDGVVTCTLTLDGYYTTIDVRATKESDDGQGR